MTYERKRGAEMQVYISVKNFGKISSARVNVSNFTVFVGNNNSGKTQLMELIYAVIKHVSALTPDIDIPRIKDVDAFPITCPTFTVSLTFTLTLLKEE